MQFEYNSDHPSVDPATGNPTNAAAAQPPPEFPAVQPIPCARITTRVFHPQRNQVATVQNVLVKTIAGAMAGMGGQADNVSWSTDSDDDMSSSSTTTSQDGQGEQQHNHHPQGDHNNQQANIARDRSRGDASMTMPTILGGGTNVTGILPQTVTDPDRAYWIQRTIRDAIYGRVWMAVVLQRRKPVTDSCEWQVTTEFCAIKEMSWQHIRRERHRLAEDPIKEVAAMQYLKSWHSEQRRQQQQQQNQQQQQQHYHQSTSLQTPQDHPPFDTVQESFNIILETNIMMPLDLLTDDRHLYSIMPYCDGGELFERLDMNERFTEPEARYWMYQVLNGIENLQKAGICHRDMSLENLLVHRNGALIIDMGMCIRIPTSTDPQCLAASFGNLTVQQQQLQNNHQNNLQQQQQSSQVYANNNNNNNSTTKYFHPNHPTSFRHRSLITPQGTCGKWIYMSPEIYNNSANFDGFAVDMWAAGVILFLMLTGFPPWERACLTDERFKYMTAGYLVQMLTEWEIGLSGDAMDLLQRMLFLDPKDRLSLAQVRAHPWMTHGPTQAPPEHVVDEDF